MAVSAHHASTNGEPYRSRRVALVLNASAGGALGQEGLGGDLESRLAVAAGEAPFVVPLDTGTLSERIEAAKASGADTVVVAGGDGSVACAAASLKESDVALGLIPCGTMNLLAKDLGLDPANRDQAVEAVLRGETRRIDAASVNGEVFLCASMLGTPARLGKHREMGRRRGNGFWGWAGFALAALRALYHNRSMRVVLTTDDGRILERRTPSITITVNRLNDNTARLFARTNLSGGELAVYLLKRQSAARQIWLLLRTLASGRLRDPDIEVFTCRGLDVTAMSSALHVLVDGELRLLRPPLRYAIAPGALRVIVP
jgi:diacylglycerol kinase family enzyme